MHLPAHACQEFVKVCEVDWANNNKETLALLGGKNKGNRYEITHIVLPPQIGYSNVCKCDNGKEADLIYNAYFQFIRLIPCGWIHTHPKHDQFLSSIDMHSQVNRQTINSSAIAIVFAPESEPLIQYYNIPARGIEGLTKCNGGNEFCKDHPNNWYQIARHVIIDYDSKITVTDLRLIQNLKEMNEEIEKRRNKPNNNNNNNNNDNNNANNNEDVIFEVFGKSQNELNDYQSV